MHLIHKHPSQKYSVKYSCLDLNKRFIYLKDRLTEGELEKARFFNLLIHSPNGHNQEPGTRLRPSQVHLPRAGSKAGQQGLGACTLIWDASTVSHS